MTTPPPIAFFDVDKTLCDCYAGYHTTVELIRRKIIKKRRLLKAIFYNAIGRIHLKANVLRMYEIAVADMAGTHIDDIMKIGQETFERRVKPKMYVEGIEEIGRLKKAGWTVALISSSPTMLVKVMEAFLGVDASFSNGPIVTEGILQKTVREPLCYKEGKVILAKQFAEGKKIPLKDCRFYTDSISDLPLLKEVGQPIVVNPDKYLRREALKEHWPILNFERTLDKQDALR